MAGRPVAARVRETMPETAVTDTHPLLFHAAGSRRLGRRAAALYGAAERREALVFVPAVVIWECGLLAWSGRVDLGGSLEAFFGNLFSNPAFQPLDLTPEQIYLAESGRPNRDPFDALVCAAARHLDLPLLTRDRDIGESSLVRVIW